MTAPNPPRKIQGVLFDMDGVLLESEPFLVKAAIQMFAEGGVKVDPNEFDPYFGMGEDHLLRSVAEKHNIPFDPEAAKARTYDLYLEAIHGAIQALPGVHEFIARCRDHDLKIALASSGDLVKVRGNLREIHLTESSFDAVVTGSDVTRKKPDPEIFLEAARRLGLEPETCLVVEDAIAGVDAAKAAGARCLAVTTNYPADKLTQADWVVPDLAQASDNCLEW